MKDYVASLATAAREYAGAGYRIFPVQENKEPFKGFHWKERATDEPESVTAMLETHLTDDVMLALYVGPSGLCVLDVDQQNGGDASFEKLFNHLSNDSKDAIRRAPRSRTPNGGGHLYFALRDDDARDTIKNGNRKAFGNDFPGIDVKAGDSYVVAPPSIGTHRERGKRAYEWVTGKELLSYRRDDIPALPQEIITLYATARADRRVSEERETVANRTVLASDISQKDAAPSPPEFLAAFVPEGRSLPSRVYDRLVGTEAIAIGERDATIHWIACELFICEWTQPEAFAFLAALHDDGWIEQSPNDLFTHDDIGKKVASAARTIANKQKTATAEITARDAASDIQWPNLRPKPVLDEAALYGLAGDLVRAIGSETEACPAALLATVLVGFGNAVGAAPHARVAGDEHPPRLSVVLVGETSSGKGTSFGTIKPFLRAMDDVWFDTCLKSGFGSGESIIAELGGAHRDPKDDSPIEHRALMLEPEFGRLLTVNGREGSTSSPVLRASWDDGHLQLRLSKKSVVARDAHLSLLAHITPDELRDKLSNVEIANGFANRCLFVYVERARKLPSGGKVADEVIARYGERLSDALRFAQTVGVIRRSGEAERLWERFYTEEGDEHRSGIVGVVTDRWAAQKLRLTVAYALLDRSAVVKPQHVLAAEAFWRYARATAQFLWGGTLGNSHADRLIAELRTVYPNGLSATEQSALFGRHVAESRLAAAREQLVRRGLAEERKSLTKGRPTRVLFARPCEKSEIGEESDRSAELVSLISLYSRTPKENTTAELPKAAPHSFMAHELNDPRTLSERRAAAPAVRVASHDARSRNLFPEAADRTSTSA